MSLRRRPTHCQALCSGGRSRRSRASSCGAAFSPENRSKLPSCLVDPRSPFSPRVLEALTGQSRLHVSAAVGRVGLHAGTHTQNSRSRSLRAQTGPALAFVLHAAAAPPQNTSAAAAHSPRRPFKAHEPEETKRKRVRAADRCLHVVSFLPRVPVFFRFLPRVSFRAEATSGEAQKSGAAPKREGERNKETTCRVLFSSVGIFSPISAVSPGCWRPRRSRRKLSYSAWM